MVGRIRMVASLVLLLAALVVLGLTARSTLAAHGSSGVPAASTRLGLHRLMGTVVAWKPGQQLTVSGVRGQSSSSFTIAVTAKTEILRPRARPVALYPGDRVLVTAGVAADRTTLTAQRIVVLTPGNHP